MSLMTTDYEDLRRYLLGRLPEKARMELEERFGDDDLFELAEATEGELLDEYFRGELAAEDGKNLIDRLSASVDGRHRIALARGLVAVCEAGIADTADAAVDIADTAVAPPEMAPVVPFRRRGILARPAARAALAAALVGLVVAVWQIHDRTSGDHGKPAISTAGRLSPPSRPEEPPPAKLDLALITLRGEEGPLPKLLLSAEKTRVELRLKLQEGETYPSYLVSIKREDGGPAISGPPAEPHPGLLIVRLKAGELPGGTYEVEVRGIPGKGDSELLGTTRFRVLR